VKNLIDIKKNYFYIFLLAYFLIGVYSSINVGITHDEAHSNWVWELNKKKIDNIFFNNGNDISFLDTYHGYYGVGFYFISTPIEIIFSKLFNFDNINQEGKILILKHPTVFIFFILSGIYLKKIIHFVTNNKFFSNLSAIFFLSYPYLFGHSLFNIKDVPMMSIWIVCTFFLIKILNNYFYNTKIIKKDLIILSLLTAYLLSLRISGLLILLEYLIFLFFYLTVFKINFINFLRKNFYNLFLFLMVFGAITYLFYPSFWHDPTKFIESFLFMSQHIQTVCTKTLGVCMEAQNLPSSYLFIWLFFKLPILILIGLFLFPLVEKKLFFEKKNTLIIAPLLTTIFLIIFLFILFGVNFYDELRQVLFLIPLIFIISLTFLFNFSKKFSIFAMSFFIVFFIFQNLKIFPYNYLWLNNLNIFLNVQKNFELDYWGVSTKKIAQFINTQKKNKDICIISNRNDGIKYFLKQETRCFKPFNELYLNNKRPFYVALMERSLNKGTPNKCRIIYKEEIKINFSKEKIVLGKLYVCN
jgi:hypothetical protein